MKQINITIMSGLPGSGKSSISKQISEKENAIIISKDVIRQMIYGCYKFVREDEKLIHSFQQGMIISALFDNKNIVIDNTHLTLSNRRDLMLSIRVYCASKDINWKPKFKIVYCEHDKCIDNRLKDNKGSDADWKAVIQGMKKSLQKPKNNECEVVEYYKNFKKVEDVK